MTRAVFIHGLESSSRGTKASWFRDNFPKMVIPDLTGTLTERLEQLDTVLHGCDDLFLIGSSFGGLMATVFALENGARVRQVILLAPALNFPEFARNEGLRTSVPARLFIGSDDTVCPPAIVIPAAAQVFENLEIFETAGDHFLRQTFAEIEWPKLLDDRC